MIRLAHTRFLACAVFAASFGCAGAVPGDQTNSGEPYDPEGVSSMVLELMVVPASVRCVNVTVVVAGTSRAQTFAVTGGSPTTVLNIGLLPLGAASVTAEAYDAVCASIAGTTPSWVADNVATTLKTGAPITLQLVFRRNNPVNATATFTETIIKTSTNLNGTLSLTANGTLLCSGTVNGACTGATTPVMVAGITDAVDVGLGTGHACYLRRTQQLACFGGNASGQLGTGVTSPTPTPAPGTVILSNVLRMAVGGNHSCAGLATNMVCWGDNGNGQLGDGTNTPRSAPVSSAAGLAPMRLSAGYAHTCLSTGTNVVCFGNNAYGQLGNGTTTNSSTIVVLTAVSPTAEVTLGSYHTCARTVANAVWCWGSNGNGQVGDGTTTNKLVPTLIATGGEATQLALTATATCALVNGAPKCWGNGTYGQVGDRAGVNRTTPTATYGLSAIDYIGAGPIGTTFFAGRAGQSMWGWGSNNNNQLGDGTTELRFAPTPVMF